jgi:hypothetical protein
MNTYLSYHICVIAGGQTSLANYNLLEQCLSCRAISGIESYQEKASMHTGRHSANFSLVE